MKITILGSGTSTGVPQLLCDCKVCRSTDSRDKRLRCSALVEVDSQSLLIDCGPDFRQQMMTADVKEIDAVLITHSHYDHVGGMDDLRPYCAKHEGGLAVYCRKDVSEDLHARIPYCFKEHPYPGVPSYDMHIIGNEPFEVGKTKIVPLPVMHYKLPITGFSIGKMAYITDCKRMPAETLELLKGTDTLIINALRFEPHLSHMNLKEALDVIDNVRPRKAYLTHMSHQMGLHAETSKILPEGVEPAFDGQIIEVID